MPETPGRLTTRTRRDARVAFSALMRGLSDYARMAVPTRGDEYAEPDFYVRTGRQISLLSQEIKFMGVVLMLEQGQSWRQVAQAVCLLDDGQPDEEAARTIYEAAYERWKRGDKNPWRSRVRGVAVMPTDAYSGTDEMAARLDEWCAAMGVADGPLVPGLRAVTDGLY